MVSAIRRRDRDELRGLEDDEPEDDRTAFGSGDAFPESIVPGEPPLGEDPLLPGPDAEGRTAESPRDRSQGSDISGVGPAIARRSVLDEAVPGLGPGLPGGPSVSEDVVPDDLIAPGTPPAPDPVSLGTPPPPRGMSAGVARRPALLGAAEGLLGGGLSGLDTNTGTPGGSDLNALIAKLNMMFGSR